MTVLDFIPTRNPGYVRPFHLSRLCAALDKIGSSPMRRIFWHGPRCGLTQTLMAATNMHGGYSFAYAASRKSLTDHVVNRLGGNVHPGDRPIAGNTIRGAYFLDGYIPDFEQWDHMETRLTPRASIFVFMEPMVEDFETKKINFLTNLKRYGYEQGWV